MLSTGAYDGELTEEMIDYPQCPAPGRVRYDQRLSTDAQLACVMSGRDACRRDSEAARTLHQALRDHPLRDDLNPTTASHQAIDFFKETVRSHDDSGVIDKLESLEQDLGYFFFQKGISCASFSKEGRVFLMNFPPDSVKLNSCELSSTGKSFHNPCIHFLLRLLPAAVLSQHKGVGPEAYEHLIKGTIIIDRFPAQFGSWDLVKVTERREPYSAPLPTKPDGKEIPAAQWQEVSYTPAPSPGTHPPPPRAPGLHHQSQPALFLLRTRLDPVLNRTGARIVDPSDPPLREAHKC